MRIVEKVKMFNSPNMPCEGIFWIINDTLISFMDKVNPYDFHSTDLLHIEEWKKIRNQYKVNNKVVSYNYYPRGRVLLIPIFEDDKTFNYFNAYVYLDKCIDNDDMRQMIINQFTLYNFCRVTFDGQLGMDGSHYNCHNCKDEEV